MGVICGIGLKYLKSRICVYRSANVTTLRFFAAPIPKKVEAKSVSGGSVKLNQQIQAEFVRVVTDEGHSVVARNEALRRAMNLKLDLVEVDRHAKPPVCKIMDYHKERYKQQVKEKERIKSKSEGSIKKGDCKEVRFSAKTEPKDLKMKADTAKRLMERGYRVKCMALGSEDQDLGGLLSRLSALIEDVAFVESGPRVEKRQAYVVVRHVKFGPSKKGGKKASMVDSGTNSENQIPANDCNHSLLDSDEAKDSEKYGVDYVDESSTPLHGQEETVWSASDTNPDFDIVFNPGLEKNGNSGFTEKQRKLDTKAAYSKAADFPTPGRPKFTEPCVRPSSQELENRYAREVAKNAQAVRNPVRLPNYGNQPHPHSNYHQTGGPMQTGNEDSSRNFRHLRNEIPQDKGGVPNQTRQFEPYSRFTSPPNSSGNRISPPSSSFGIFSATEGDASGKYGLRVAVNQHYSGTFSNVARNSCPDKLNSPIVKSGGRHRSENDESGKWEVLSRENADSLPARQGRSR